MLYKALKIRMEMQGSMLYVMLRAVSFGRTLKVSSQPQSIAANCFRSLRHS